MNLLSFPISTMGMTGGHKGVQAFLSGIRKDESGGFPDKNMTIDQVAAEHVGSATRFPSITAGSGQRHRSVLDSVGGADPARQ